MLSEGRVDIKTNDSSVRTIKFRQVFAESRRKSVRAGSNTNTSQQAYLTMTSTSICLTSFLLFALSGVSRIESIRPDYIHCQTNLECGSGYCCTIGPMRYSIPQCKPLLEEGNLCRPGSDSTLNMTATYPDGAEVLLTDVHYILCPCADGLACDTKEGVCKNAGEKRDTNRLLGENSKPDD